MKSVFWYFPQRQKKQILCQLPLKKSRKIIIKNEGDRNDDFQYNMINFKNLQDNEWKVNWKQKFAFEQKFKKWSMYLEVRKFELRQFINFVYIYIVDWWSLNKKVTLNGDSWSKNKLGINMLLIITARLWYSFSSRFPVFRLYWKKRGNKWNEVIEYHRFLYVFF